MATRSDELLSNHALERSLRYHTIFFVLVNTLLVVADYLSNFDYWSIWLLFGWGLALSVHFFFVKSMTVDDAWVDERSDGLAEKSYDFEHIEDIRTRMQEAHYSTRPNDERALAEMSASALCDGFGAEIHGVDLSEPMSDIVFKAIYAAFSQHQVLLFREQHLSPAEQVAFAHRFGEVQVHVMNQYHDSDHPELYTLSNLDEHGEPSGKHPDKGTLAWHTDGSWQRVTAQATMMYALEVPIEGGETHFCNMYAAYDALTDREKTELEGKRAVHNLNFSRNRHHGEDPMTEAQRASVPPVDHPIVRTHPETGRKCLYLGDHAEHVVNMDYDAGRQLIERLNAESVAPERVYEHRWTAHELIIWDNRCLTHRATEYDTENARRVIQRCTVIGETPR